MFEFIGTHRNPYETHSKYIQIVQATLEELKNHFLEVLNRLGAQIFAEHRPGSSGCQCPLLKCNINQHRNKQMLSATIGLLGRGRVGAFCRLHSLPQSSECEQCSLNTLWIVMHNYEKISQEISELFLTD